MISGRWTPVWVLAAGNEWSRPAVVAGWCPDVRDSRNRMGGKQWCKVTVENIVTNVE
jgi:hypothetical protein